MPFLLLIALLALGGCGSVEGVECFDTNSPCIFRWSWDV